MTMKTTKYNITPDKQIYTAIAARGYSLQQAIAELIDNSIDANASKINIVFKEQKLLIRDDGIGMYEDELVNAMVLGKSNKKESLGIYGIGLKSACLSLGESFKVETKPEGSNVKHTARIDKRWIENKSWKDFPVESSNGIKDWNGFTQIEIDLKNKYHQSSINLLRGEIGKTYLSLLWDVNIFINNEKVDGSKYIKESKLLRSIEINNKYGKYIVEIGRLQNPTYSDSGINVIRKGRTIWYGKKYGYIYHPHLNGLIIVIRGTSIPISSDKRDVEVESPIWKELEKELLPIINTEVKKCTQENKLQPEKMDNSKFKILKERMMHIIRNLELYGNKKGIGKIPIEIVDVPINNRDIKTKRSNQDHKKRNPRAKIGGKLYDFEKVEIKDRQAPLVSYIEKDNIVQVVINEANDIFDLSTDKELYIILYFYEGVARFIADKIEEKDKWDYYRDLIVMGVYPKGREW